MIMEMNEFKKTSKVTYVSVFGFINNNSQRDFIGYVEVPFTYDDFVAFNEKQRIAICQAVILRQTGHLIQGFMKCDPDEFFKNESQKASSHKNTLK